MRHINPRKTTSAASWDRQQGESSQAFAAFQAYLKLGEGRSLRFAYRAFTGKKHADQPSGRWKSWSTRFDWEGRARDYDLHFAQVRQAAAEEEARKEEREWIRRRATIRQQEWELSQQLLERAKQMLSMPVVTVIQDSVIEKRLHSDGEEYDVVINRRIVEPVKWEFLDAARMIEISSRLARMAVGQSVEHTSVESANEDASVSQEEIDNRVLELLERARARAEAAKKDEPEKPN